MTGNGERENHIRDVVSFQIIWRRSFHNVRCSLCQRAG
jgi:hypothetical protein